jgi:hypothetical protein
MCILTSPWQVKCSCMCKRPYLKQSFKDLLFGKKIKYWILIKKWLYSSGHIQYVSVSHAWKYELQCTCLPLLTGM